jgi:hypothetical protein
VQLYYFLQGIKRYCGGYTPGVLCPGVLPPAAVTFAAAQATGVVSAVFAVFAGRSFSGDP